MSFRTAYNDFKRSSSRGRGSNRGLIRDNTPSAEKKMMDDYYKMIQKRKAGTN